MSSVALISGLIGALLSAGLSYWIRSYLDKKNLQNSERALAYVHLVQVSHLVAMRTVITTYFKTLLGDKITQALASKDGLYQPIHKAAVVFANLLKNSEPKKWKETAGVSILPVFFKSQLESISASKLTADQLAKLPRDAVLSYSQFLNSLSYVRGIVLIYISLVEDSQPPLITAENILDQWLTINKFFDQAEKLRLALIKSGAATDNEAGILLKTQIAMYSEQLLVRLKEKPQVEAALAEATSAADKTKSVDAGKSTEAHTN
ncbi:MAG: hypothetical protein Q8L39_04450 [Burkholderiales bacterium]|nr:hypothetical protein [Burkholderiales bacterium]